MDSLRIVVSGLAASYPFGGVFWDYMHYVLGLLRLGHEVLYIEDIGKWGYEPGAETFVGRGDRSAAYLARNIAALDPELADRWFLRDASGATFGRPWRKVAAYCRTADLFLDISASCWMREEYFEGPRVVLVDTDPMYTQAALPRDGEALGPEQRWRLEMLRRHHAFFTIGENIGAPDCKIPTAGLAWAPTRQPIVLDRLADARKPSERRRPVLTTVGSWEPTEEGPLVEGVMYVGKSREFERFIDLPSRSPLPLELALSGRPPTDRLRASGWTVRDGYQASRDPWSYLDYIGSSAGEWSVAKNAYVMASTGWFSNRTATYLALGLPAVVQDTGFSRFIPTGEGLLAFATVDEAVAAVEKLAADPARHAHAARELATEYFDSGFVLDNLLERAMSGSFAPSGPPS